MLKQKFADNLRKLRKSRNLTQEKLAELVDVDFRYISFIENARNFPSAELIEKLAKALEVDYSTMFTFEEDITRKELEANLLKTIKYLSDKNLKILHKFAEDLISNQ